jgi:hypothetical protein
LNKAAHSAYPANLSRASESVRLQKTAGKKRPDHAENKQAEERMPARAVFSKARPNSSWQRNGAANEIHAA